MSSRFGESHASVYRKAVREADRQALNRELVKIWDATHVAVYKPGPAPGKIYAIGTKAECDKFAEGLGSRVTVRRITPKEQNAMAQAKRRAFGNP